MQNGITKGVNNKTMYDLKTIPTKNITGMLLVTSNTIAWKKMSKSSPQIFIFYYIVSDCQPQKLCFPSIDNC